MALASFTIERDRQALLPFIRAAQRVAGAPIKLLASPWSPPAWMKTTGRMNDGGKLRPEYRRAWARCYVRFIEAYEAEGVPIWGVSVQNEPVATQRWDSCLYTAEEERDFVRDYLGPGTRGRRPRAGADRDLGPQPRPDGRARERGVLGSRGRALRVGHRLPLVRRGLLRPRAAGPRRLARQAAAVHRRLPGRRAASRLVGAGRALRALDDQRPEPLDGRLDRLEPAAGRGGRPEPRRQLLQRARSTPMQRPTRSRCRARTTTSGTSRASSGPARTACSAPRPGRTSRRPRSATSTARRRSW